MKWLPIETAPRDGTNIIITFKGKVTLGLYCKVAHVPLYGFHEVYRDSEDDPVRPTHWMPIPQPPTNETGETL